MSDVVPPPPSRPSVLIGIWALALFGLAVYCILSGGSLLLSVILLLYHNGTGVGEKLIWTVAGGGVYLVIGVGLWMLAYRLLRNRFDDTGPPSAAPQVAVAGVVPPPAIPAKPSGWVVLVVIPLIGLAVFCFLIGGGCLVISIPALSEYSNISKILPLVVVVAGPSLLVGTGLIMLTRRLLRGRPRPPS